MPSLPHRIALAIALPVLGACAGHKGDTAAPATTSPAATASSSAAPARRAAGHRSPTLITRDELADPAVASLGVLDAIRQLRPSMLNFRGSTSVNNPSSGKTLASIDGGPVSDLAELQNVRSSDVLEIRYLNASDAMLRFGTTANQGPVILVRRR